MQHTSHPEPQASRQLPEFNLMQTVKRRFFAMRNGALAAQMRAAGLAYRINFGLNIPQIKEIASEISNMQLSSFEMLTLANSLWENETTRESRLLAPMIYPADLMTSDTALSWMRQTQTTEIADHLCHSLLRHLPFATGLAETIIADQVASDINRYTAIRLILNLLISGKTQPETARRIALSEQQRNCPATRPITIQILSEIDFLLD